MEHKYGFSPVWILIWAFKYSERQNVFVQTVHCRERLLRSLVWWVCICAVSPFSDLNCMPHAGQMYIRCSVLCMASLWILRIIVCLKDWPHWVQRYGRESECVRSWKSRVALWPNRFVHPGALQAYGRSPVWVTMWSISRCLVLNRWSHVAQINTFFSGGTETSPVNDDLVFLIFPPLLRRPLETFSDDSDVPLTTWVSLLCIRRPRTVLNFCSHILHFMFLTVRRSLSLFILCSVSTNMNDITARRYSLRITWQQLLQQTYINKIITDHQCNIFLVQSYKNTGKLLERNTISVSASM